MLHLPKKIIIGRFNVIESSQVNAWCLPGGKIAFYEGILDIMENEGQIAAVMGHEIAHATARHGGERISLGILTQVGAVALQIALKRRRPCGSIRCLSSIYSCCIYWCNFTF